MAEVGLFDQIMAEVGLFDRIASKSSSAQLQQPPQVAAGLAGLAEALKSKKIQKSNIQIMEEVELFNRIRSGASSARLQEPHRLAGGLVGLAEGLKSKKYKKYKNPKSKTRQKLVYFTKSWQKLV